PRAPFGGGNMIRVRALLLCALSGCAGLRVQPLARLPLTAPAAIAVAAQSDARVLFYPFEEQRGGEFARAWPTSHVPFLSLLHAGGTARYPETGLRAGKTVYVG